jgi:WD40 repeat protein
MLPGSRRGPGAMSSRSTSVPNQRSPSEQPPGRGAAAASRSRQNSRERVSSSSNVPAVGGLYTAAATIPDHVVRYVQLHSADGREDLEDGESTHSSVFCGRQLLHQVDGLAVRCLARVGEIVVVGERSGALSIWSFDSVDALFRLEKFTGYVDSICEVFAPTSSGGGDPGGDAWQHRQHSVWVGFSDGALRVLDIRTATRLVGGAEQVSLPTPPKIAQHVKEHAGSISAILPSFNGLFVFTASTDFTICRWDATSIKKISTLSGHRNGVACLAVQGIRLFSGGSDKRVLEWDVVRGKVVSARKGHTGTVRCMIVTGDTLWTGADDGTIRVWDLQDSRSSASTASRHGHRIIAERSEGETAANEAAALWTHENDRSSTMQTDVSVSNSQQPPTGSSCLRVIPVPEGGPCARLALAGGRVWSSSFGTLFVWDAQDYSLVGQHLEHEGHVTAMECLHTAAVCRLWSCSADGTVKIWNSEGPFRRALKTQQASTKMEALLTASYSREERMRHRHDEIVLENQELHRLTEIANKRTLAAEEHVTNLQDQLAKSEADLAAARSVIRELEERLGVPASGHERVMKLLVEQLCRPERALLGPATTPVPQEDCDDVGSIQFDQQSDIDVTPKFSASKKAQEERQTALILTPLPLAAGADVIERSETDRNGHDANLMRRHEWAMRELILHLSASRANILASGGGGRVPEQKQLIMSPPTHSSFPSSGQELPSDIQQSLAIALAEVSSSPEPHQLDDGGEKIVLPSYVVVDSEALHNELERLRLEIARLQNSLHALKTRDSKEYATAQDADASACHGDEVAMPSLSSGRAGFVWPIRQGEKATHLSSLSLPPGDLEATLWKALRPEAGGVPTSRSAAMSMMLVRDESSSAPAVIDRIGIPGFQFLAGALHVRLKDAAGALDDIARRTAEQKETAMRLSLGITEALKALQTSSSSAKAIEAKSALAIEDAQRLRQEIFDAADASRLERERLLLSLEETEQQNRQIVAERAFAEQQSAAAISAETRRLTELVESAASDSRRHLQTLPDDLRDGIVALLEVCNDAERAQSRADEQPLLGGVHAAAQRLASVAVKAAAGFAHEAAARARVAALSLKLKTCLERNVHAACEAHSPPRSSVSSAAPLEIGKEKNNDNGHGALITEQHELLEADVLCQAAERDVQWFIANAASQEAARREAAAFWLRIRTSAETFWHHREDRAARNEGTDPESTGMTPLVALTDAPTTLDPNAISVVSLLSATLRQSSLDCLTIHQLREEHAARIAQCRSALRELGENKPTQEAAADERTEEGEGVCFYIEEDSHDGGGAYDAVGAVCSRLSEAQQTHREFMSQVSSAIPLLTSSSGGITFTGDEHEAVAIIRAASRQHLAVRSRLDEKTRQLDEVNDILRRLRQKLLSSKYSRASDELVLSSSRVPSAQETVALALDVLEELDADRSALARRNLECEEAIRRLELFLECWSGECYRPATQRELIASLAFMLHSRVLDELDMWERQAELLRAGGSSSQERDASPARALHRRSGLFHPAASSRLLLLSPSSTPTAQALTSFANLPQETKQFLETQRAAQALRCGQLLRAVSPASEGEGFSEPASTAEWAGGDTQEQASPARPLQQAVAAGDPWEQLTQRVLILHEENMRLVQELAKQRVELANFERKKQKALNRLGEASDLAKVAVPAVSSSDDGRGRNLNSSSLVAGESGSSPAQISSSDCTAATLALVDGDGDDELIRSISILAGALRQREAEIAKLQDERAAKQAATNAAALRVLEAMDTACWNVVPREALDAALDSLSSSSSSPAAIAEAGESWQRVGVFAVAASQQLVSDHAAILHTSSRIAESLGRKAGLPVCTKEPTNNNTSSPPPAAVRGESLLPADFESVDDGSVRSTSQSPPARQSESNATAARTAVAAAAAEVGPGSSPGAVGRSSRSGSARSIHDDLTSHLQLLQQQDREQEQALRGATESLRRSIAVLQEAVTASEDNASRPPAATCSTDDEDGAAVCEGNTQSLLSTECACLRRLSLAAAHALRSSRTALAQAIAQQTSLLTKASEVFSDSASAADASVLEHEKALNQDLLPELYSTLLAADASRYAHQRLAAENENALQKIIRICQQTLPSLNSYSHSVGVADNALICARRVCEDLLKEQAAAVEDRGQFEQALSQLRCDRDKLQAEVNQYFAELLALQRGDPAVSQTYRRPLPVHDALDASAENSGGQSKSISLVLVKARRVTRKILGKSRRCHPADGDSEDVVALVSDAEAIALKSEIAALQSKLKEVQEDHERVLSSQCRPLLARYTALLRFGLWALVAPASTPTEDSSDNDLQSSSENTHHLHVHHDDDALDRWNTAGDASSQAMQGRTLDQTVARIAVAAIELERALAPQVLHALRSAKMSVLASLSAHINSISIELSHTSSRILPMPASTSLSAIVAEAREIGASWQRFSDVSSGTREELVEMDSAIAAGQDAVTRLSAAREAQQREAESLVQALQERLSETNALLGRQAEAMRRSMKLVDTPQSPVDRSRDLSHQQASSAVGTQPAGGSAGRQDAASMASRDANRPASSSRLDDDYPATRSPRGQRADAPVMATPTQRAGASRINASSSSNVLAASEKKRQKTSPLSRSNADATLDATEKSDREPTHCIRGDESDAGESSPAWQRNDDLRGEFTLLAEAQARQMQEFSAQQKAAVANLSAALLQLCRAMRYCLSMPPGNCNREVTEADSDAAVVSLEEFKCVSAMMEDKGNGLSCLATADVLRRFVACHNDALDEILSSCARNDEGRYDGLHEAEASSPVTSQSASDSLDLLQRKAVLARQHVAAARDADQQALLSALSAMCASLDQGGHSDSTLPAPAPLFSGGSLTGDHDSQLEAAAASTPPAAATTRERAPLSAPVAATAPILESLLEVGLDGSPASQEPPIKRRKSASQLPRQLSSVPISGDVDGARLRRSNSSFSPQSRRQSSVAIVAGDVIQQQQEQQGRSQRQRTAASPANSGGSSVITANRGIPTPPSSPPAALPTAVPATSDHLLRSIESRKLKFEECVAERNAEIANLKTELAGAMRQLRTREAQLQECESQREAGLSEAAVLGMQINELREEVLRLQPATQESTTQTESRLLQKYEEMLDVANASIFKLEKELAEIRKGQQQTHQSYQLTNQQRYGTALPDANQHHFLDKNDEMEAPQGGDCSTVSLASTSETETRTESSSSAAFSVDLSLSSADEKRAASDFPLYGPDKYRSRSERAVKGSPTEKESAMQPPLSPPLHSTPTRPNDAPDRSRRRPQSTPSRNVRSPAVSRNTSPTAQKQATSKRPAADSGSGGGGSGLSLELLELLHEPMRLYHIILGLQEEMASAKRLFEESLLAPMQIRQSASHPSPKDRSGASYTGGAASSSSSLFSPPPRIPGAADDVADHRSESLALPREDYISALLRFYEKREVDWLRISGLNEELQELHQTLFTQTTLLAHRLQRFVFLFDTRPVLTRALVELHRVLQQCVRSIRQHEVEAERRQLSAAEALALLSVTSDHSEQALQGNRWVLANLFTEDELHHLACSPSHFLPDDGNARPTWRDITLPASRGRLVGLLLQAPAISGGSGATGPVEYPPRGTVARRNSPL